MKDPARPAKQTPAGARHLSPALPARVVSLQGAAGGKRGRDRAGGTCRYWPDGSLPAEGGNLLARHRRLRCPRQRRRCHRPARRSAPGAPAPAPPTATTPRPELRPRIRLSRSRSLPPLPRRSHWPAAFAVSAAPCPAQLRSVADLANPRRWTALAAAGEVRSTGFLAGFPPDLGPQRALWAPGIASPPPAVSPHGRARQVHRWIARGALHALRGIDEWRGARRTNLPVPSAGRLPLSPSGAPEGPATPAASVDASSGVPAAEIRIVPGQPECADGTAIASCRSLISPTRTVDG